ncbi:hypothetical protein Syun_008937 [Stephania yunnanensis]|uniref:Uncharacterized protein n=1 Tax=Stephania yunnanensis TaxID=152371 RepID=A0AAP0KDK0_9MAGN
MPITGSFLSSKTTSACDSARMVEALSVMKMIRINVKVKMIDDEVCIWFG